MTGIDAPYEEPENAEVVVETDQMDVEREVERVRARIKQIGRVTE